MSTHTVVDRAARRRHMSQSHCLRCQARIRWLRLDGTRWRFDPDPVDHRSHASPPAYPIWRGRAWPVAALTTHLVDHFDLTERQAQLTVESCTWLLLHACRRGGDQ